jgi:DNA-binding NarL/FixJ family response regulator
MTPGWIHVYLLSENRLLREALTKYINKKNNVRVVGASAFSSLAIDQIIAAEPDILLSDTADHALSELQVVPEVLKAIPGLKVVMFGMESDKYTFLRSVQKGVMGYVLKDASTAEVLEVVRAVANDEAVCPSCLQRSLFEFVAGKSDRMPSYYVKQQLGLSRREQQLVQMIGRGLTNKEIASELNLSEQTIKNHVHSMLRKLGANDRLAVVELCRQHGLVA